MVQLEIDFGGFYGSEHDDRVDSEANHHIEDYGIEWDELNYRGAYIQYSKDYVDFLNYELETDMKFIELWSPREYNFSTDKIIVDASKKDCINILHYTLEYYRDDLIEAIQDATTGHDGYIPFYTYSDMFKSENRDRLMAICFRVLCRELDREWDNFYDLNCVFENISSELMEVA